jgi:SAM-dependent methyltransferase
MHPLATAAAYDHLAQWWHDQHRQSQYGLEQLKRAIQFSQNRGLAIDIGCGSSGRFISYLLKSGFTVEGLDVSARMIDLAQEIHPGLVFYCEDVCEWQPCKTYDLILAWDSLFHLPLATQKPVLIKLCQLLNNRGILLFTCGGGAGASEVRGSFQGQTFEYSTLGINKTLDHIDQQGCTCLHLEYDQYPENHVYIVVQKV